MGLAHTISVSPTGTMSDYTYTGYRFSRRSSASTTDDSRRVCVCAHLVWPCGVVPSDLAHAIGVMPLHPIGPSHRNGSET